MKEVKGEVKEKPETEEVKEEKPETEEMKEEVKSTTEEVNEVVNEKCEPMNGRSYEQWFKDMGVEIIDLF